MNEESQELLTYVYRTVEMGKFSSEELMTVLRGKDNKIKIILKTILEDYNRFYDRIKQLMEKEKIEIKAIGTMSKLGVTLGMKKGVLMDNSDGALADMLVKGLTMGALEMDRKLSQYEKLADKRVISLVRDVYQFQEKRIEDLKMYL